MKKQTSYIEKCENENKYTSKTQDEWGNNERNENEAMNINNEQNQNKMNRKIYIYILKNICEHTKMASKLNKAV